VGGRAKQVGSREVEVTGVTKDGAELPILRNNDWVLT